MSDNSNPTQDAIETFLHETRHFEPPHYFTEKANIQDPQVYAKADADPVAFWEGFAKELDWFEPWTQALEWELPYAKWFVGGKLNVSYNCLDRHVNNGKGDKTCIIWEGEPGEVKHITYSEALTEVCRIANALKELGVQKGDRVCIYMPMVPELAYTMLACTRIGAVHSVIFGGFSADSIKDRTNDAAAKIIVTADGGWRRGKVVELKKLVDEAIDMGCPSVERVLVLERMGHTTEYNRGSWNSGRDLWWHEIVPQMSETCEPEAMDAEDLMFILYTSGSTGKPKGIMHTTGGYLTGVYATTKWVFDIKDDDIYWCTADCGWITGHSYIVYGPMSNGATVVMYEGAPDAPEKDRFWRIIERHKVTIFYTAPTAIRTFMKWGRELPMACNLSSLRLLGSVGEPINPEAWIWYYNIIGRKNCPVVDTWWQTETGHIMIAPLPGLTTTTPGSATRPFPGIRAEVVDEEGHILSAKRNAHKRADPKATFFEDIGGILALTHPWPGMLRGIWGDPERYESTYWSKFPGKYFPGDGTKMDEDGNFWLLGRVDDIMLVAGHNVSTMEVESALVDHPAVAEAAVIGKTHEIKGQAIAAFVIIRQRYTVTDELIAEIRDHVGKKLGPITKPDDIIVTADLPKTRSGKIMRRLLRDVAEGRALGDTTTLADPTVVASLKDKYESSES